MTFAAFKAALAEKSPEILLTLGCVGMGTAIVFAVKATPKALRLLEERDKKNPIPPTTVETIKTCWKPYVPAAVIFVVSLCCVISSHSVDLRRNAALAAAYAVSDTALREYREKTVDILGKQADEKITDAIAREKIEQNPPVQKEIILTKHEDCLCYDVLTGRYFRSSVDALKRAECEINNKLRNEDYVSLNEFYYEIGLDGVSPIGDNMGWNVNRGYLTLTFSSQLTPENEPCVVMSYSVAPHYGYYVEHISCESC